MRNADFAGAAVEVCRDWYELLVEDRDLAEASQGSLRAWVFGSSVFRGGEQFKQSTSDIDLVCLMPANLGRAGSRVRWQRRFRVRVEELELRLAKRLNRGDFSKPIVSVILASPREIASGIHKSGAADFYRESKFLELGSSTAIAGPLLLEDEASRDPRFIAAAQFAHAVRNQYAATTALGKGVMSSWSAEKSEPVHKDYARKAAIIAARAEAKFDTSEGLELVSSLLYRRRDEDPLIDELYDIIRVRRNARGELREVTPEHQLLLAEMLLDHVNDIDGTVPARMPHPPVAACMLDREPVRLRVSSGGLLQGEEQQIIDELFAVAVNMRWNVEPAFELEFAGFEELKAAGLGTEVRSQAEYFDRVREWEKISEASRRGVDLIVRYWKLLMPHEHGGWEDDSLMPLAIGAFLQKYVTGNPGFGVYDLYFRYGSVYLKTNVGLPSEYEKRWLAEHGVDNALGLSIDNPWVWEMENHILAEVIVPQMIYAVISSGKTLDDEEELRESLNVGQWRIGPA